MKKNLKNQPESGEIYTKERKLNASSAENKNYVPGQILVKLKGGTDEQTVATIQREMSLETIRVVHRPDLYLMKILDGKSVETIIKRLRDYPTVAYTEPNYRVRGTGD